IVIDGVSLVGAITSTVSPDSCAALWVVGPNTAIFVSPCLKSLKFCCNERIPCGLNNTSISYSEIEMSDKSEQTVRYIMTLVQSRPALSRVTGISGLSTSEEGRRYFSEGNFLKRGAKSEKVFSPKLILRLR